MGESDLPRPVNRPRIKGAGGTPGGFGSFFLGLAMTLAGGYLVLNQVSVTSQMSAWGWPNQGGGFGPMFIVLLLGVGVLFFNSKNVLGWLLAGGAMVGILLTVVMNLQVFFRPTTLLNTLVMFILLAGGLGLILRSFRPSSAPESTD